MFFDWLINLCCYRQEKILHLYFLLLLNTVYNCTTERHMQQTEPVSFPIALLKTKLQISHSFNDGEKAFHLSTDLMSLMIHQQRASPGRWMILDLIWHSNASTRARCNSLWEWKLRRSHWLPRGCAHNHILLHKKKQKTNIINLHCCTETAERFIVEVNHQMQKLRAE